MFEYFFDLISLISILIIITIIIMQTHRLDIHNQVLLFFLQQSTIPSLSLFWLPEIYRFEERFTRSLIEEPERINFDHNVIKFPLFSSHQSYALSYLSFGRFFVPINPNLSLNAISFRIRLIRPRTSLVALLFFFFGIGRTLLTALADHIDKYFESDRRHSHEQKWRPINARQIHSKRDETLHELWTRTGPDKQQTRSPICELRNHFGLSLEPHH